MEKDIQWPLCLKLLWTLNDDMKYTTGNSWVLSELYGNGDIIFWSGHMTMVHTDHKSLMYFRKAQRLSDWQARWALFLSEFDIKLQHLPGHKLILSNALSRWFNHCPDDNEIKEEMVLPVMEMLGWIKYHNQLQSTNNILYVCLS